MRQQLRGAGIFLFATLATIFTFQFSQAQQCTLPSRIFLPQPDTVRTANYGQYIDVDNGYMVVGAPYVDSLQVYAGLAYVYKLNTDNQWVRIAKLAPSDPSKYGNFGMGVAIAGNSIAIFAVEFNDAGDRMGKIYVYEKPAGDWASTTENYILKNSSGFATNTFGKFALRGDELIAIAEVNSQTQLQVYHKDNGTFSLVQSISTPTNQGGGYYSWDLAVSDSFFAIGSSQFINADGSYGAVFVYEKNGTYKTIPAKLTSSLQTASNWQGFGVGLTAYQSTLFVAGLNSSSSTYNQTYYVFEQPTSGWVDSKQAPLLETPQGATFYFQLAANDNYLFITGSDHKSIRGFKKPAAGWSTLSTSFVINDLKGDTYNVGNQVSLSGNHLIVGCPSKFLFAGITKEFIADYYSATGELDASGMKTHQIIQEITKDATDNFFGFSMSANDNYLAIGASQDSRAGVGAGAVYLYGIPISNGPPEKIYSPEQENYVDFGHSVAMGDSVMFVSAPAKDSLLADKTLLMYSIGKVYVYRLGASGWKYHSQLLAPKVQSKTTFGQNVTYFRGYVAITEFYTGDSENVGLVHLYKEDAQKKFKYLATLQPSVALRANFFGRSVIMNDSLIVVATGNFAVNSDYRMQVYIYKKKGEWKNATEDATLSASDSGWSDRFGFSIAMYGDYIAVGAPYSPGYDPRPIPRQYIIPGAAYIYKRPLKGWKGNIFEMAKITPSDPSELGSFGYSVAIDHDDLFIGSPQAIDRYNYTDYITNYDNSLKPGKVYHYKKPTGKDWMSTSLEDRVLTSFEPEALDGYGFKLLVSDRYLYVNALLDDNSSGFRAGSVQTMMQLPVIDSIKPLCVTSPPINLAAFPSRGQWIGDGVNSTNKTFNPFVAGVGIHNLSYTVSGCQASASVKVIDDDFTVIDESATIQTKCTGSVVSLLYNSNEDAPQYRWYYKDSPTSAYKKLDSLKKQISINKPGYYEVRVSRKVCPLRKEDFTVFDEAPVTVKIDPVTVICSDVRQTLSATPLLGKWTGPGVLSNGIFEPANLPDGNYSERYEFVTPVGCRYRDSVSVKIDKLKVPALVFNNEKICGSKPVILQLNNVDDRSTVEWFDESQNKIQGQGSSSLLVAIPGNYSATVTKFTCMASTPSVTVEAQRDSLYVPNVFTPNGDAFNDYFEIRSEGMKSMELAIFNRYGGDVFRTNDPSFRWSGDDASPGVYFWRITYATCTQSGKEQKGWVQIVR